MAELLPDQLRMMADAFPDEVGYTDVGADLDLTFGAWEARSNQLARWLMGQGVDKGDRVALHVPPEEGDRFLIGYSAIHKAGAVAVPTSTRLVARELGYVLGHAGAVVAISGTASTTARRSGRSPRASASAGALEAPVIATTAPAWPST